MWRRLLSFAIVPLFPALQRWIAIERHDVRSVNRLHTVEIDGANRLDQLVDVRSKDYSRVGLAMQSNEAPPSQTNPGRDVLLELHAWTIQLSGLVLAMTRTGSMPPRG